MGIVRADDDIDLVALDQFVRCLQSHVGLELIVLADHRGLETAHLAVRGVHPEQ